MKVPLANRLEEVRMDYVKTSNALAYVTLEIGDVSIHDVMCAYLIACEWCAWIKKPKMKGNPLKAEKLQKSDYTALYKRMDEVKHQLELKLTEKIADVRDVFLSLNRKFVVVAVVLSIDFDVPDVEEATKRYYKRLLWTAKFFEKVHGRDEFSKLLHGQ